MRLFLAIDLPEKLKKEINKLFLTKLAIKGIKPVEACNLHLTVYFLGEKSESEAKRISETLSKLEFEEFEIKLKGVGFFPYRVIFIELASGVEKLEKLNKKVTEMLSLEKQPFKAHLTLARNKFLSKREFLALIEKLNKIEFEKSFIAHELVLFKSTLTQNGPIYEKLASFKFRGKPF